MDTPQMQEQHLLPALAVHWELQVMPKQTLVCGVCVGACGGGDGCGLAKRSPCHPCADLCPSLSLYAYVGDRGGAFLTWSDFSTLMHPSSPCCWHRMRPILQTSKMPGNRSETLKQHLLHSPTDLVSLLLPRPSRLRLHL
jgi:hypothetical protein